MWAAESIKAGKLDEALAILRKAAASLPQGGFNNLQTWVYISPAEEKAQKQDWAAALAIVEPATKQFQDKQFAAQLAEIQDYQASLFDRWATQEIAAKRFPEAAKVLEMGLTKVPSDRTLAHNLAYVVQEWSRQMSAQDGPAKADQLVLDLVKRHPTVTELKQVAVQRLRRGIDEQLKAGKFEGAATAVTGLAKVVEDPAVVEGLTAHVYNTWAISKLDAKDWSAAVEIFGKGRQAAPKSSTLEKNEEIAWHQWTHSLLKAQDWAQAVKVFAQARARYPKDDALENNEKVAWSRWAGAQGDKEEFAAALQTMAAARARFPKDEDLASQEVYFWQKRCEGLFEAKDWPKAVELLKQARERFPEQKTLEKNEAICWLNWSIALSEKKDWAMAVKVLEQAVKRFPEDDQLLENLKICRENLDK
jgi:tetratricopeptide (TPR) repeat protein